jgi:hypothetical protein
MKNERVDFPHTGRRLSGRNQMKRKKVYRQLVKSNSLYIFLFLYSQRSSDVRSKFHVTIIAKEFLIYCLPWRNPIKPLFPYCHSDRISTHSAPDVVQNSNMAPVCDGLRHTYDSLTSDLFHFSACMCTLDRSRDNNKG